MSLHFHDYFLQTFPSLRASQYVVCVLPSLEPASASRTMSRAYPDARRDLPPLGVRSEWNGKFWERDTTLLALRRAREVCRGAAVEANTGAKAIASNKTIAAVANLVRADARHVTTIEQWDSDIAAFLTRHLRRRSVG